MRIRTVVVEDQLLARERLVEMLAGETDVDVVASCGSGVEAVSAIREHGPDLVLLDLQMPDLDGFGVIAEIGSAMPLTIFVTAYDEFALRAFEVHAFDYLLKPFGRDRFLQALGRARAHLAEKQDEQLARRFVSLVEHAGASDVPSPVPDRLSWTPWSPQATTSACTPAVRLTSCARPWPISKGACHRIGSAGFTARGS